MAEMHLTPREWKILMASLENLRHAEAIVDGVPVALGEYVHVCDSVAQGLGEELAVRAQENRERARPFADTESTLRFVDRREQEVKPPYTGPERRGS